MQAAGDLWDPASGVSPLIAAAALPGWDPEEMPRLGFFAALVDRRLGRIPFSSPPEFPWESDPTTWAELELVDPSQPPPPVS